VGTSPGEDGKVLRGEGLLDFRMRLGGVGGKEHYADGERLRCVESRASGGEQEVARDGGGDADAVARLAVGGYGAAVLEACKGGKCFLQNVMRRDAGKRGDEADTAGFVVEAGINQASRRTSWALE